MMTVAAPSLPLVEHTLNVLIEISNILQEIRNMYISLIKNATPSVIDVGNHQIKFFGNAMKINNQIIYQLEIQTGPILWEP